MNWNSKEQVLKIVKQNGFALEYASEELKNDKEIVLEVVKQNGYALKYASKELKNDKEVVLEAVKQNGYALRFVSETLKNDKQIVLISVRQNGNALHYASEILKNDKEVVLISVKQDGYAIYFASETLKNNKEFILMSVKENIFLYRFTNPHLTGKEFNELFPNTKLRKKIHSNMTNKGFTFKIGINKDINEFKTDNYCCAGGFYITLEQFLDNFPAKEYGSDIYEIKIPEEAKVYIEDYDKMKVDPIEIVRKIN